jgi:hypothetical protein
MLRALLLFLCFVIAILVAAAIAVWRKAVLGPAQIQQEQLLRLSAYQQRLRFVVSGLLSRANEIDQASKYLPVEISAEWHDRLEATCTRLVTLSDSINVTDSLLKVGDLKSGEDNLVKCCRVAGRLSKELRQLKFVESTVDAVEAQQQLLEIRDGATKFGD